MMAALRWAALALVLFSPLVWAERGEQVFITEYYQDCSLRPGMPGYDRKLNEVHVSIVFVLDAFVELAGIFMLTITDPESTVEYENTVDQGGVGENGSELRQFTYLFYNTVSTESVSGNYVLHYETACKVPDTCSGIVVGPGLFSFDIAASVCPTAISATTTCSANVQYGVDDGAEGEYLVSALASTETAAIRPNIICENIGVMDASVIDFSFKTAGGTPVEIVSDGITLDPHDSVGGEHIDVGAVVDEFALQMSPETTYDYDVEVAAMIDISLPQGPE